MWCKFGRENGDDDVMVKIQYCGVCHSDLHNIKNEWGFTNYPVLPGYDFYHQCMQYYFRSSVVIPTATAINTTITVIIMEYLLDEGGCVLLICMLYLLFGYYKYN